MYATILRNLSLWSVASNESSFGEIGHGEEGRHKMKFVRYKSCHSINIHILLEIYIFRIGMMMLPPAMISLPFKLLLFVLVDGWHLVVQSLVQSFMS